MTDLSNLRLFTTQEHECGYLTDQKATTLFVDPDHDIDKSLYSQLSELGFRRSGAHIYRPHCNQCQACTPARIPTSLFVPNRSQKRCLKRNQDIHTNVTQSIDTPEHYQLYARYIEQRHKDGDMYPPSKEQYLSFLTSEWGVTEYINFYLNDVLVAVSVVDRIENGLSAIYTFFEPELTNRSLGVYALLWQIEYCQNQGLTYLYLGYWIKKCQKMSYKLNYRPLQLFHNQRWLHVK